MKSNTISSLVVVIIFRIGICSVIIQSTTYSNVTFEEAVVALPNPEGEAQQTLCGQTTAIQLKIGDGGFIQSPNYPKIYEQGLNCEWQLEAEEGARIQATFFDMRVKVKTPGLSGGMDSLFVSLDGDWVDSQRFSGDMNNLTPFSLISDANKMYFRFKSSPSSSGSNGFRIGYHVDPADELTGFENLSTVQARICQSASTKPVTNGSSSKNEDEEISGQYQELDNLSRSNSNPFLVAMVLDEEEFCSGALIRNDLVVTSAHCTQGVQRIDMIFGTDDLRIKDAGVQTRSVAGSAAMEHPSFDPVTQSSDISLIRLDHPVILTKFVKPARLPSWSFLGQVSPGFSVNIAGWSDSDVVHNKAQTTRLVTSPSGVCRSDLNKAFNGLMICSKGNPEEGKCQVDSGSPVTVRCSRRPQDPPRPQRPQQIPSTKIMQQIKPTLPYHSTSDQTVIARNGSMRVEMTRRESGSSHESSAPFDVLLGVSSFGSCEKGFVLTRATAYLDFLKGNLDSGLLRNGSHV